MKSLILAHPIKIIGIAAFILLGVSVAYKIVAFARDPFGPATIIREEIPLTVERARAKDCPIPLPDSARNVQFDFYCEFIDLDMLVRFEAPAGECRAFAQQLVDTHRTEEKRPSIKVSFESISSPPKDDLKDTEFGPVPWFDVASISEGVTAIVPVGNYAQIWIDDKRGVFYFRQTD